MKEALMYIIGSLVENPQAVKVGVAEDGDIVRFKLELASSDRGKVIGKEGRVVRRFTRKGKIFWGCSRYPDCDFASWTKPEANS